MSKKSRRKFVKEVTTGLAASLVVPAIVRGQNLNSRIRVDVVGMGGRASNHTESLLELEKSPSYGVELTGVCDCDSSKLTAEILEGHMSWALCHLANIAYRVYRTVHFDGNTEMFLNDDAALQLLTRPVRDKFFVPDTI